jgi:hypothetical protein
VALTFIGPPPEGKPLACHINGKPWENRVDNIYWGDHIDNGADWSRHRREIRKETLDHRIAKIVARYGSEAAHATR